MKRTLRSLLAVTLVAWCSSGTFAHPASVAAAAQGPPASARPPNSNCTFGRHNLSGWTNRTVIATGDRFSTYNVSLCGNLPTLCHDSLTHAAMPPGAVFSMFGGEASGTCWDVLAHWEDLVDDGASEAGLSLLFRKPFDAHLGCAVTVGIDATCNRSLPRWPPMATGRQTPGACHWQIHIETADEALCTPAAGDAE